MNGIDFLEHGGAGERPFVVRLGGNDWPLEDPRELHFQTVLLALHLRHLPGIPQDIPCWQHDLVFDRWCAAWDLPEFVHARRLAYLVDKYRDAIANDLTVYTHQDLGELWRSRRWGKLLNLIDRLPAYGWYNATVSDDEEHAKMMAESYAARRQAGDEPETKGPSLVGWTPEVAVLHTVADGVRRVEHAVFAAQHGKKAGAPPEPLARPQTALERAMKRAEYERRKKAHESLVARVLPHKAAVKP